MLPHQFGISREGPPREKGHAGAIWPPCSSFGLWTLSLGQDCLGGTGAGGTAYSWLLLGCQQSAWGEALAVSVCVYKVPLLQPRYLDESVGLWLPFSGSREGF